MLTLERSLRKPGNHRNCPSSVCQVHHLLSWSYLHWPPARLRDMPMVYSHLYLLYSDPGAAVFSTVAAWVPEGDEVMVHIRVWALSSGGQCDGAKLTDRLPPRSFFRSNVHGPL